MRHWITSTLFDGEHRTARIRGDQTGVFVVTGKGRVALIHEQAPLDVKTVATRSTPGIVEVELPNGFCRVHVSDDFDGSVFLLHTNGESEGRAKARERINQRFEMAQGVFATL